LSRLDWGRKNEILVDVGRRDSVDNEFVDRACQTPGINAQGSGKFAHLLQAHIGAVGLAQSDCLPTNDNMRHGRNLQTLVALFQSIVSSVMPLVAVFIAEERYPNKQLYSDSVHHNSTCGNDRTLSPNLRI
jgi:hypothetical protein